MKADRNRDRESASDAALQRLATYGSLAPGRPNHHELAGLDGHWSRGKVYGTLVDAGWGAGLGYPALILDPEGSAIDVHVFESVDLAAHWSRLDDFEGPGYERVVTTVRSPGGDVDAFIYVLSPRDGLGDNMKPPFGPNEVQGKRVTARGIVSFVGEGGGLSSSCS